MDGGIGNRNTNWSAAHQSQSGFILSSRPRGEVFRWQQGHLFLECLVLQVFNLSFDPFEGVDEFRRYELRVDESRERGRVLRAS